MAQTQFTINIDSRSIEGMREALKSVLLDWREDGSHPANYIRETGLGDAVAKVDRWCGGYQDSHRPEMIGWKATYDNSFEKGFVTVVYGTRPDDSIADAIEEAKRLCDEALERLLP